MTIKFPRPGEFLLRDDPMIMLRRILKVHGFDGKKKYFWIAATIIKILLLFDRIAFVLLCLDRPRRVAELTASLPVAMTGVLKMVYLYVDKSRVNYLYDTITTEFWDYRIYGPQLEKEAKAIFKYANRILWSYIANSVLCLTLFLMFPVADMPSENDRILPNVVWSPVDLNPSPLYEIVFMILFVNGILTYLGNAAYDYFYSYCVQHLVVQFIILKELLRNITEDIMSDASDVEKFNSKYFQDTVMERMKICSEHHSKLLKYGKNIESYCWFVLVPQLVLTYAALVVNAFMLSTDRSDVPKTITLFNLSVTTFIQLAQFAIPSSQMNAQSISVLNAVYDSKWYLFNARMKRACTFMMMNGQEGIVVKAGGTTKINNPLLVDMLQKVFSAVTLLRALIGIDGGISE
nr:odorant receptor 1 [Monochamus saltuarius]